MPNAAATTRRLRTCAAAKASISPAPDAHFRFYVGVHQPALAWPLTLRGFRVCISANVLAGMKGAIPFIGCDEPWMMDSGAFTQVALKGGYTESPRAYAALVRRFEHTGLRVAATQDFMCEDLALRATGLSVTHHLILLRATALNVGGSLRGVQTSLSIELKAWGQMGESGYSAVSRPHLDADHQDDLADGVRPARLLKAMR